jgi:hypothetical protein
MNREIKKNVNPFVLFPINILNSLCNPNVILLYKSKIRFVEIQ